MDTDAYCDCSRTYFCYSDGNGEAKDRLHTDFEIANRASLLDDRNI